MKTVILIPSLGGHVALDEADVRALIHHHAARANLARNGAMRTYHQRQADGLKRCLQDALDRTEAPA